MLTLGIDIGGSSVKAALLRDEHCLATGRSGWYRAPDRGALAAAVAGALETALAGLTTPLDRVGLCAPGLLDRRTLTITKAINMPGIVGMPLPILVDDALRGRGLRPGAGQSLLVTTDAHATAFDLFATERLEGRLLCLALGTGVGACVLDDGVPLHVSGETPGHIGHIDVSLDDDPPIGPDGARGTLESYVGLPALITAGAFGSPAEPAARQMLDPAALDRPLRALARAIRICHALYRPDHVRLAGGLGIRLGPFLPRLRKSTESDLTSLARSGWDLHCGTDDLHAARGAARLGAHRLE